MPMAQTPDTGLWPDALAGTEAAILVVDPVTDQVLGANQSAARLLDCDLASVNSLKPSKLFGQKLPLLIILTDECLSRGHAWTDTLEIRLPDHSNSVNVEVFLSHARHDGREAVVLMIYPLNVVRTRRARAEYDRLRGTSSDVANIERIFRDLSRGNQLLLNAVGEGIYGVNARGELTFLNPAGERMLGWKAEELTGLIAHQVTHHTHENGENYPITDCPIYAAFRDGAVHRVSDEVFWRRDGTCFPVEYTSTPIEDAGQLIGAVVVFRDVSQQRQADQKLRSALTEVEALTRRLEKENAYLQDEIRTRQAFGEIIGDSEQIHSIIEKIQLVAPTDSSVLIVGESGTGKELIAHAIHSASERKARPLIRVNCAAIPRDLFESEFFGHRKGAFTGAIADRTGRFEMADGGTIFLDEISEMPIDMQGKLLRVLQEGQFERIGETRTINSDFRVIAATNRDLKEEAKAKRFREDLYYRIAVFPIEAVPLRERPQDIPLLVQHFMKEYTAKHNIPPKKCTIADMERLQRYSWPGNIRELRNVVEHAMIISRSRKMSFPLLNASDSKLPAFQGLAAESTRKQEVATAREMEVKERENIIAALKLSKGKVSGPGGAAEILGIKAPTLYSRLKRFSIDKSKL